MRHDAGGIEALPVALLLGAVLGAPSQDRVVRPRSVTMNHLSGTNPATCRYVVSPLKTEKFAPA